MTTKNDEVMDLLEALAISAYNFRVAGQSEKANFLGATEALLRTYFGCDKMPNEPKEMRAAQLN